MSEEPVRMDFAKHAMEMKAQFKEEIQAMENGLDEKELKRLAIPPRYWPAQLSDFKSTDLVGLAGDPIEIGEPRSLFIHGSNGTGKTYLAAVFAKAWRAHWILGTGLALAQRAYNNVALMEYLAKYEDCTTLIIDDMTAGHPSEFTLAMLVYLLSHRDNHCRNTIVTSYHSLKEIDGVDPSLASRLSGYERIKLLGEDRRFQARGRTAPEAPAGT